MHARLSTRQHQSLPVILRLTLLLLLLSISVVRQSWAVHDSSTEGRSQAFALSSLHAASSAVQERKPVPKPAAVPVAAEQRHAPVQFARRARADGPSDQTGAHYFRGRPRGYAPVQVGAIHVPILVYHYLSTNPNPHDKLRTGLSVAPEIFARQCRYLADNGYTTITLDEYLAARAGKLKLPARPVILTFDDGYRDFYTNAYPILRRYQMRATIYIISDKVGQPAYMTWKQLRELAASPLITIGAHTRTHVPLDDVPTSRAQDEIVVGKQILEEQLGIPIKHFCYPYGHYSEAVRALVGAAGYLSATTTRRRIAVAEDNPLLLPRIEIGGTANLVQFKTSLHPARSSTSTLPQRPRPAPHLQ